MALCTWAGEPNADLSKRSPDKRTFTQVAACTREAPPMKGGLPRQQRTGTSRPIPSRHSFSNFKSGTKKRTLTLALSLLSRQVRPQSVDPEKVRAGRRGEGESGRDGALSNQYYRTNILILQVLRPPNFQGCRKTVGNRKAPRGNTIFVSDTVQNINFGKSPSQQACF